jgi:hypothetical protein
MPESTQVKQEIIVHWALRPATDFTFPLSDADVLSAALCMKAVNGLPEDLWDLLEDKTPLHWFTTDRAQVTCEECEEWLHA